MIYGWFQTKKDIIKIWASDNILFVYHLAWLILHLSIIRLAWKFAALRVYAVIHGIFIQNHKRIWSIISQIHCIFDWRCEEKLDNNRKGFAICVHLLHAIVDFNYGKLIFVECELMIFICWSGNILDYNNRAHKISNYYFQYQFLELIKHEIDNFMS